MDTTIETAAMTERTAQVVILLLAVVISVLVTGGAALFGAALFLGRASIPAGTQDLLWTVLTSVALALGGAAVVALNAWQTRRTALITQAKAEALHAETRAVVAEVATVVVGELHNGGGDSMAAKVQAAIQPHWDGTDRRSPR